MKKLNIRKASFIDLFAGIGGFRIVLESFGLRCVYSSEWDKYAQMTYEANFGEIPVGDITQEDVKDIPKHDIICAGFPCQAFSISGKQRGFADTRGTLFFDIVRIADYHRPEILFLENVYHLERHDNGRTLSIIKETLNSLGYNVFYRTLNASYYGVPTSRRRIYLVCFHRRMGIKEFQFPEPTNKQVSLREFLEPDDRTKDYVINCDDIRITAPLPSLDVFGQSPLKPLRIGTINSGGQGERVYSDLGHAITLSAYGGGVASKTGAYLINGKIRKLSPRECARIMGFPDSFKIPVSSAQAYKQFGNSVAIELIKQMFARIIDTVDLSE